MLCQLVNAVGLHTVIVTSLKLKVHCKIISRAITVYLRQGNFTITYMESVIVPPDLFVAKASACSFSCMHKARLSHGKICGNDIWVQIGQNLKVK